jgi:arylsulfatase A-like enzyme
LFFSVALQLQSADKRNFAYILADNLGWADVGYHGGYIKTPNLDRLAREVVELDHWDSIEKKGG